MFDADSFGLEDESDVENDRDEPNARNEPLLEADLRLSPLRSGTEMGGCGWLLPSCSLEFVNVDASVDDSLEVAAVLTLSLLHPEETDAEGAAIIFNKADDGDTVSGRQEAR